MAQSLIGKGGRFRLVSFVLLGPIYRYHGFALLFSEDDEVVRPLCLQKGVFCRRLFQNTIHAAKRKRRLALFSGPRGTPSPQFRIDGFAKDRTEKFGKTHLEE